MAEPKRFRLSNVAERNNKKDAIFIIDNVVYDVTKFLDDHPGGHEVLLNVAGKDASDDFNDIGHSFDARELMKKYVIGELVDEDKTVSKTKNFIARNSSVNKNNDTLSFLHSWKFSLFVAIILTVIHAYVFGL